MKRGDGYIVASLPMSLIRPLSRRSEVTSIEDKVEAYLDPLANIALAGYEATSAQEQTSAEPLTVEVNIPLISPADFFLGEAAAYEVSARAGKRLRQHLIDGGATIVKERGTNITAQLPMAMLRELSEMPYVGAILTVGPQIQGLTPAEEDKITHHNLADIIASQTAGIALPYDDVNNLAIRIEDGKVRIAIIAAGSDAETDAANVQRILDFLTANGGNGKAAKDSEEGPFVWGIVPVSALVALVKLAAVESIRIQPLSHGPVGPLEHQFGTNDGGSGAIPGAGADETGGPTVAMVVSEGRAAHGATAWHDAGVTPGSLGTVTGRTHCGGVGKARTIKRLWFTVVTKARESRRRARGYGLASIWTQRYGHSNRRYRPGFH